MARKCNICEAEHPTLLHGYQKKRATIDTLISENVLNSNERSKALERNEKEIPLENFNVKEIENSQVNMCVVPICVKYNEKCVLTYAMLDNCSTGTFIDEELLSLLGSNFANTNICVKTTGHEASKSKIVNGLKVRGISLEKWINLPQMYSCTENFHSPTT